MTVGSVARLSTDDHRLLEKISQSEDHPSGNYALILNEKLAASVIVSAQNMPDDVVVTGCRVVYSINGERKGPMMFSPQHDAFSVYSLHGLALLGRRVGEAVEVQTETGTIERLVIEHVFSAVKTPCASSAVRSGDTSANVIPIQFGRRAVQPVVSQGGDDDDPGPSAA